MMIVIPVHIIYFAKLPPYSSQVIQYLMNYTGRA